MNCKKGGWKFSLQQSGMQVPGFVKIIQLFQLQGHIQTTLR